jgi:hypothetical protein
MKTNTQMMDTTERRFTANDVFAEMAEIRNLMDTLKGLVLEDCIVNPNLAPDTIDGAIDRLASARFHLVEAIRELNAD